MAKTFFAGLKGGSYKACIYQGPDDVITTPGNRLQDVFFHSDLAYLKSNTGITGTVSLPVRTPGSNSSKKKGTTVIVPAYGSASYQLTSTDYTSTNVLVVDTTNNRTIGGTTFYQQVAEDSFRIFTISVTSAGVYLNEFYCAYSATIPANTFSFKIYPVVSPTDTTDATYWMYVNPSNFRIKNGTFNSNLGYINVKSSSAIGGSTTSSMSWSSYYYATGGSLQRYFAYYPESNKSQAAWDYFLTSKPPGDDPEKAKAGVIVDEDGFASTIYNPADGFTYDRGPEVFRKSTYNFTRVYYVRNAANTAWVYTLQVESDIAATEKFASKASAEGQNPSANAAKITIVSSSTTNGNAATQHGSGGWIQFTALYPRSGTTLTYLVKDVNVEATGSVIFYQIRRGQMQTTVTGRSGAVIANGLTLDVFEQPDRAAGTVLFNFDGQTKGIGDIENKPLPQSNFFGLNLK